jgi:23S rRNA (uracil1939-C5)-methyltransferase
LLAGPLREAYFLTSMSAPICPHQPSCPGCPRLAMPGLPPEPLARLQALAAQVGIAAPALHPSPPTAFRRRAKLAIRGRADAPKLGIFEAGSHRAVHIPRCLVHHPVLNRVAAQVRDALARHHVPTYSDAAHLGLARYLQVVVERESDRAQVVLITNSDEPSGVEALLSELQSSLADDLHSLWWNGNPERTNSIVGAFWRHFHGPAQVSDRSGNAQIFYPPSAFGQSNLDLAMQLAARVRELASGAARVTEYYAGVGAIGLGLAESVQSLRLNELGAGSLAGLELGIAALPAELQPRVELLAGSAGSHAGLVADSDLVIADPPRKGLDAALKSALLAAPPERFVYVSCDVDTFLRDAAELNSALELTLLEAYDLFPHTEHLETLAVFSRRSTQNLNIQNT